MADHKHFFRYIKAASNNKIMVFRCEECREHDFVDRRNWFACCTNKRKPLDDWRGIWRPHRYSR